MSRKTRRDLVWALAAALCGGLLPACTRTRPEVAPAGPRLTAAQPAGADDKPLCPRLPPVAPSPDRAVQPAKPGPVLVSRDTLPLVPPPDPTPPAEAVTDQAPHRAKLENLAAEAPPEMLPAVVPRPQAEVKPPAASPPLVEALRCFLDNRPADALACLKAYDQGNQELLLVLLPLAARLTEGSVHKANPKELAFFIEQLSAAAAALRPRAELVIDKICFCDKIETFGVYEPTADKPSYRPGDRAKVYIEVRNFSSAKREDAPGQTFYETSLETSAEVMDGRHQKVWPPGPDRVAFYRDGPDRSRTLRHDYFDRCFFRVPDLAPGSYTLWIQVEDVATGRVARRSLDFDVRHPGL